MIGENCFQKVIEKSRFFTAIQNKLIVYKKRWYFRCSTFIHHSVNNFPVLGHSLYFLNSSISLIWQFQLTVDIPCDKSLANPEPLFIAMFFVIFKLAIFPVEQRFFWFSYPRWITRKTAFSFILNKVRVSVNALTCQFVSMLRSRC